MRHCESSVIPWTTAPEGVDAKAVGDKAHRLFELHHQGFPVPPWFVVSCRVMGELIDGARARIEERIREIDHEDHSSLAAAAAELGTWINAINIPPALEREIVEATIRLFGAATRVAVRSSAVGEDSAEHSFAGQLDSFLGVGAEGIAAAMKRVWASAYSQRALAYRRRVGLPLGVIPTAVIVQEMIDARVSGILFTRPPQSHRRDCVITAGFGLGEGVVQDVVATDTYRIGWTSRKVRRDTAVKRTQVAAAPSGSHVIPVPPSRQTRAALADAQVRQLRNHGVRAEKCFGSPQDIEWAIDQRGGIHILQARPIVSPPGRSVCEPLRVWDNANIVESYPGLTRPLTFTFIRDCYETTFSAAAMGFVWRKSEMRRHQTVFANMIGLLRGRVYYNLLNWYRMLSFLPGLSDNKRAWDQMIGIGQACDAARMKLSLTNRIACVVSMLYRLVAVQRTATRFFAGFRVAYERFRVMDTDGLSMTQLADHYFDITREFGTLWRLTLYNDFSALKYYDWLKRLCDVPALQDHANLHNDLLCGRDDIESVAPLESLARIAARFTSDPRAAALLKESSDEAVWSRLMHDPSFDELQQALAAHIRDYGDRGLEELKLDTPTLREEPSRLIHQVREWFDRGQSLGQLHDREREIRERAIAAVRRRVRNPFRRLILQLVLRQARRAISNRENMRFARTRVYGLVRALFRRLGEHAAAAGLISGSGDIHYLTVGEVLGFVNGTNVTHDAKALVAQRRAEYERFAAQPVPSRLETSHIPRLSPMEPPPVVSAATQTLTGVGCSSGVVEGTAVIVRDPRTTRVAEDSILIAQSTDPGWVFLMARCRGIVVERGSLLSHTAIIGRELGVPTIVGAVGAQTAVPAGARIRIDGGSGVMQWS